MVSVRLRGHHFLCMLTFVGEGYTPSFVANMRRIVKAIKESALVELIDGPDEICGALSSEDMQACKHDCYGRDILQRDKNAIQAVQSVIGRSLSQPQAISLDEINQLRAAFLDHKYRKACTNCRWKSFCDEIAQNDYEAAEL